MSKRRRIICIALVGALSLSAQAAGALVHTVEEGETLKQMAERYDSSISAMISINGIRTQRGLRAGDVLEIPQYLRAGEELPAANKMTEQIDLKKVLSFDKIDPDAFFPTHKTSYMIHGRITVVRELVKNNLEGTYYETQPFEDVILRGTSDETWVTPMSKVLSTYTKKDGSPLTEADFSFDKYTELYAQPTVGNFAAFVPVDTIVRVDTAWGDVLYANAPGVPHGKGDYLVCRADETGEPDLSDVWVVNGAVFPHTYDTSKEK